jgi:serine/threonine-protein kinase
MSDPHLDDELAPTELVPATLELEVDTRAADRYRLGGPLGASGMRAAHDRRLSRYVALKELADRSVAGRHRFLREAMIQSQLEHPGIVPLYDLEERDGVLAFSMRRPRGMTLAAALAAIAAGDAATIQRFPLHKLLGALSSAAQAIRYAHARGVAHLDLRPKNILLGDFGEVYVLDWSAARLRGESVSLPEESTLPMPGSDGDAMGAPGYLAPEQIRGQRAFDERSDIHALGAILFEMVTRRPLYAGRMPLERAQATLDGADVRARAAGAEPAPPEALLAICERATRAAAADRYASVTKLLAELEAFLEGGRDTEMRRAAAVKHAESAARSLAASKSSDSLEARKSAMQHCGRALVLDPGNRDATRVLRELLTDPPARIPAEVADSFAAHERHEIASMLPYGIVGVASFAVFLPVAMWMGVRSWAAIGAILMILVWALAASWAIGKLWPTSQQGLYPAFFATSGLIAGVSAFFGPLIVVPTIAAVNTMIFMMHFARPRWWPIVVGWASFVVPATLQLTGVLRSSYAFSGGTLQVLPWAVELPRVATTLFLAMSGVVSLLAGGLMTLRLRETLNAARLRAELYTWHLEQLLPDSEREATA